MNIAICDKHGISRKAVNEYIQKYQEKKKLQFQIFHFESGEELIEKFDETKTFFDLVFLDYKLVELNGLDTAHYIRMNNTDCNIVFILSKNEHFLEFDTVKPLRVLVKPVSKRELYSIFKEIIF